MPRKRNHSGEDTEEFLNANGGIAKLPRAGWAAFSEPAPEMRFFGDSTRPSARMIRQTDAAVSSGQIKVRAVPMTDVQATAERPQLTDRQVRDLRALPVKEIDKVLGAAEIRDETVGKRNPDAGVAIELDQHGKKVYFPLKASPNPGERTLGRQLAEERTVRSGFMEATPAQRVEIARSMAQRGAEAQIEHPALNGKLPNFESVRDVVQQVVESSVR